MIHFVFVSPQLGVNIGAAARVMKNFGFTSLRLVNPQFSWPDTSAVDMAVGAKDLLEKAVIYPDLANALADIHLSFAATARKRDMQKNVYEPAELKSVVSNCGASQIAIIFGPERAGLTNSDLSLANYIVSIPVDPNYPSLNLAQTVSIIAYELRESLLDKSGNVELATNSELQHLFSALDVKMQESNFYQEDTKRENMLINVRNIFTRIPNLTSQEVRTIRGLLARR